MAGAGYLHEAAIVAIRQNMRDHSFRARHGRRRPHAAPDRGRPKGPGRPGYAKKEHQSRYDRNDAFIKHPFIKHIDLHI